MVSGLGLMASSLAGRRRLFESGSSGGSDDGNGGGGSVGISLYLLQKNMSKI